MKALAFKVRDGISRMDGEGIVEVLVLLSISSIALLALAPLV